jgi:hypothetical protein
VEALEGAVEALEGAVEALRAETADVRARLEAVSTRLRGREVALVGAFVLCCSGVLGYLVRLAVGATTAAALGALGVLVVRPSEPAWLVPAVQAGVGRLLRRVGSRFFGPRGGGVDVVL